MANDHLDSMGHAELAAKTRELRDAAELGLDQCSTELRNRVKDAIDALKPTPLDKLRQTLREQGFKNTNDFGADAKVAVELIKSSDTCRVRERWVHDA